MELQDLHLRLCLKNGKIIIGINVLSLISRTTGKTLTDFEHMVESIQTILTTPIGSRYFNREFGSDLFDLIDGPINEDTKIDIYAEVIGAIEKWEPRFKVDSVEVNDEDGQNGKITINLQGIYVPENKLIKLENLRII